MANAQNSSVEQSHRMANHLRGFRDQLGEVNAVEVRLADLHDQASAVQAAHGKLALASTVADEYKTATMTRIEELEQAAKPASDIKVLSLSSLPEGWIIWFHSHVNPQVAALSDPNQRETLRRPHPKVPSAMILIPVTIMKCWIFQLLDSNHASRNTLGLHCTTGIC